MKIAKEKSNPVPMPMDDVLRRMLTAPPAPKEKSKPDQKSNPVAKPQK